MEWYEMCKKWLLASSDLSHSSWLCCVFLQGGRWRRRQSGRRQQPTRHHLNCIQDIPEHCRQRQGRKHRRWASDTDELRTHSCISATGFPVQLKWAAAGAGHAHCLECVFSSHMWTRSHQQCCQKNNQLWKPFSGCVQAPARTPTRQPLTSK